MREHVVVPAIGSRDVACTQRPYIRSFEHFLKLFDVANDAFNVPPVPISNMSVRFVKRSGICTSCLREGPTPNGSQRFLRYAFCCTLLFIPCRIFPMPKPDGFTR